MRRLRTGTSIGAVLLAAAAAAGGWLLVPSAPAPASALTRAASSPSTAPAGANGVPAPVLWQEYCSSCHGEDGRGTDRAPDLAGVGEAAVDFMLTTGRMPKRDAASRQPPYSGVLPAADIRALDAYVTALVAKGGPSIPTVDPGSGDLADGLDLFDENCAGCHGFGGGGGILFNRPVPKVTQATPTQVGEAVRIGPGQMPVFGPKVLSAAQVDDIAAYVRSIQHPDDRGGDPISHLGPVAEGAVAWFVGIGLILVARWIGKRG